MLERRGVHVSTAANGSQALELAASESFDLILMDCQMPGLDEFECTRAIRSLDGGRGHVPIVALTAYGLVEDKQRFVAAGFIGLVTKPYSSAARPWTNATRSVQG